MQRPPSLWKTFLICAGCIPFLWLTNFYLLFHFGLGISLRELTAPFVFESAFCILFAPLFYLAFKRQMLGGDSRLLIGTGGAFGLLTCWLYVYYGSRIGIIPAEQARADYIGLTIFVPTVSVLGYYVHRKFLAPYNGNRCSEHKP